MVLLQRVEGRNTLIRPKIDFLYSADFWLLTRELEYKRSSLLLICNFSLLHFFHQIKKKKSRLSFFCLTNIRKVPTYSHPSNKRGAHIYGFWKISPSTKKIPPSMFIDSLVFSTLHSSFIRVLCFIQRMYSVKWRVTWMSKLQLFVFRI